MFLCASYLHLIVIIAVDILFDLRLCHLFNHQGFLLIPLTLVPPAPKYFRLNAFK